MASKARQEARLLELAERQAKCQHDWRTVAAYGDIIVRCCNKCDLEEEKDVG